MPRTIVFICLILSLPLFASAQVKSVNLSKADIPISIKYKGQIINAVKYKDDNGEYLLITTETGITPSPKSENDGRSAALFAYNYIINKDGYKLYWQTTDFVEDCPVDVVASYVPKTFAITDLDKNGIAEVWLMYETACRGDVSPGVMKIIMHEGDKKYAVRGENKVKVSNTGYTGGKYTLDEAFKSGPKLFRDYAANLWAKNLMETWK